MSWRARQSHDQVKEMLIALERQAREAGELAERAQRHMGQNRFTSFIDFRRKVEEVAALASLIEDRLKDMDDSKLADLRAEFERMDFVLTTMLAKATRNYFSMMRDDQALPIGARELFEPELRNVAEVRAKLLRSQYAPLAGPDVQADLAETEAVIRRIIARSPALPDFSDMPSPDKPKKRLPPLGLPAKRK